LCRNILLSVREGRLSRPDLVVKYGCYLLSHHSKRLGPEQWAMYEQVYIALLQYGKFSKFNGAVGMEPDDMRLAQEYYTNLSAQFPDSLRVKRLEGMMWEAKGEFELAMNEYDDILKDDPNNMFAVKRQVALLRARGRPADAVRKLVDHLSVVCSDSEAWVQLSDLYLSSGQYRKAAFCMEELLLLNPMAYMYHVRYGELLFTMASAERSGNGSATYGLARKYFAHALELKPQGNLRALYGMLLCCATVPKAGKAKDATIELAAYAKKLLLEEYATQTPPSPMLPAVKAMIDTLLS